MYYIHCFRRGDILMVDTDKVPEVALYNAICVAAMSWGARSIIDFTSVENTYIENLNGKLMMVLNALAAYCDLTHISLASFLWDIGKQRKNRSDAAKHV